MRRLLIIAVIAVTAVCLPLYGDEASKKLHDQRDDAFFTQTGDVLRFAIPASALGYSLIIKDLDGAKYWALSVGSAVVLTEGLKYAVGRPRPYQNSDERGLSFPSGHTAWAFAGAAYWQRRYGWKAGAPAYALAAAVGCSRVWSKNHYWTDVAAGAAVGTIFPYIFTKSYKKAQINAGADQAGGEYISLSVQF
ncbi:phosphatidic acid phosphatase [Fibrobacteres bacterium R8-0-B4]